MEYELIREIFNQCSNNQMRDVFVSDVETGDPEQYLKDFFGGKEIAYEEDDRDDGSRIFDVTVAGLRQRFSFTPVK